MTDSPLLAQPGPLDDTDTQSVLVKPTRAFAPVALASKAAPAPVTLAPAQPSVVEKPTSYEAALHGQESGGNPFAKSKSSSSAGLSGFTDGTWHSVMVRHPELGLTPDGRSDSEQDAKALRAFTQDNAKILEQHDISVNPGNLYIMHFMGEGAGPKFLRATQGSPAAPAATLFPKEAAANPTIFFEGGDPSKPRSLSQVYALQTKKFGGASMSEAPKSSAPPEGAFVMPEDTLGFGPPVKIDETNSEPPEGAFIMPKDTPGFGPAVKIDEHEETLDEKIDRELADPHLQERVKKAISGDWGSEFGFQQGLGLASGLEGFIAKLGGLLPDWAGGKESAAKAKELEQMGSPGWQKVGEALPLAALPLGLGAEAVVGKAAEEAAPAVAEAAKTGWPRIMELAENIGKGGVSGAKAGAIAGGAAGVAEGAGTEGDWSQRLKSAGISGLEGAGGGVLLGGGIGGAMPLVGAAANVVKGVPEAWQTAKGSRAAEAGEKFAGEMRERVEKSIAEQEKTIAGAEFGERLGEKLSKQTEAELQQIHATRQTLEDRNKTTARTPLTDRMVEEINSAKKAAQKSGLPPVDAERFALQEQQKLIQVEQKAEEIAKKHAARGSEQSSDPKEVGDDLQRAASDIYNKGVAERSKVAGIDSVIKKAGAEPKYKADIAVSYIKETRPHVSPSQDAVLKYYENELSKPMSLARFESMRKDLASALQTKQIKLDGVNATPVSAESAHHLSAIYKRMMQQDIKTQSSELYDAIGRFRALSRPLDQFRSSLKDVIATDTFSGDYKMGEAAVADKLLSRAKSGQTPIAKLIQERPELKESMERLFNRKFFGYADNPRELTAKEFGNILEQNKNALEQSGLYEKFSDLRTAKLTQQESVERARLHYTVAQETAERQAKEAEEIAKGRKKYVSETMKDLSTSKSKAEAIRTAHDSIQTEIKAAMDLPEAAGAEAVAKQSRGYLDDLVKAGVMNETEHYKALEDLLKVENEYKKTKDAQAHLKSVAAWATGTVIASGLVGAGVTHLRRMGL